jgi:hypothetical protein
MLLPSKLSNEINVIINDTIDDIKMIINDTIDDIKMNNKEFFTSDILLQIIILLMTKYYE